MQRFMGSSIGLLAGLCIGFFPASLQAEEAASAAAGKSSRLANEAAIRRALDDKTILEFVETPLTDVVDYLKDKHRIEVRLDKKEFDNAGLGTDTPITIRVRNISLRSALQLMLKEFDLTWVIENEVLLITTVDYAGQRLETVVYDVADLVATEDGIDYDSLIDAITSIVAPDTWSELGGPGAIASLHRMLVLNQTELVHEQVASLLAEMRRVRKERGDKIAVDPAEAPPLDPKAVSVKVYRVPVPMVPRPATAPPATIPPATIPPATDKPAAVKPNAVGAVEPMAKNALAQYGTGGFAGGTKSTKEILVPDDAYITALAVAIPGLVRPESWAQNGGQGTLYVLPADATGNGELLVRQTGEVHGQLKAFLKDLAASRSGGGQFPGGGFF